MKKKSVDKNNNNTSYWIKTLLTLFVFGMFYQIINLLFHPTLTLDDKYRDLLNIIIGAFLASFSKIIDFWFHNNKHKDN